MNEKNETQPDLFETAVAAVRDEAIDAKAFAAVRDRVRARLSSELAAPVSAAAAEAVPPAHDEHRIHGCAGFRALLPAYAAGALVEAKRVLVEDHTRECVGCRKALTAIRRGETGRVEVAAAPRARRFPGRPVARWAMAAGLAGLAVVSGALLVRGGLFVAAPTAVVQSIDGELAIVEAGGTRPARAGERFGGDSGARAVRTAGGSGAVVTLADGSRVELAERSELALGKRWDGTVLRLARGSVIVEAAEQRRGHLYVETGDCQVAVVGTIFSVNAGARGSRVSVIEGEVRVHQGTRRAVLRPGDQLATGRYLGAVPVDQEIAWSRNAADYRERLAALRSLGRELDRTLVQAGMRTSTRLLDLAPEGTSIYVAVPNLSQSLAQAWTLVRQRAAENPALAEWWSERMTESSNAEISDAIETLARFGAELGPEIAITVAMDPAAEVPGAPERDVPVLVAEVLDPARFSPILDAQIAEINAHMTEEGAAGGLRRIADPATATANGDELLVWLHDDLLVVSPSAERLANVAAIVASNENAFTATPFHGRLAAVYAEGTDWLLGVDLASVIAHGAANSDDSAEDAEVLDRAGFADLDHLVIDRRDDDGSGPDASGQNRAQLTFREERHGIASWLSTPAPLGALEFVSPAAHVAVAALLKDPAEMLDDALALATVAEGEDSLNGSIAEIEARLGISLRGDIAAALGGDAAFAFDGPWLPQPSWKLVLEVADAARLHAAVQALVEAWNREAVDPGPTESPRPTLRLTQESVDGRVMFTLSLVPAGGGAATRIAHGLFADGYLLLGPSKALLLEAVAQRAAGVRLSASQAFLDLVPHDGRDHVSALVWQNLGGSLGSIAELVHRAMPRMQAEPGTAAAPNAGGLAEILGDGGPGLAVAYADGREISFVTRGLRGPLGLSFESLLAIGGLFRGDVEPDGGAPEPEESAAEPAIHDRAETRTRTAA